MDKTADTVEAREIPDFEEMIVIDDTPHDAPVIVNEPIEEKEFDFEKNKDLKKFLTYVSKQIEKVPQHSGQTTTGCERAIAHYKMLDRQISKMIAEDMDCEIDDLALEKFRKELRKNIKKLEKRYNEINDTYDSDDKLASNMNTQITKESKGDCGCKTKIATPEDDTCPTCKIKLWGAGEGLLECISCDEVFKRKIVKEAGTPKVQLVVSPWERAITGIIINSVVSQGKNADDVYNELKNHYKFSNRDELSISQLLLDMGYPTARNFMTGGLDKNIEFSTNYSA